MRWGPLTLVVLVGCMPASHRAARRLEGRYATGKPGSGWTSVAPSGADFAWFNESFGAMIYTDSNCGPRYAESKVEDLAAELLAGLRGVTGEREEYRDIGGREGVLRVHRGKLDGVEVRLGLAVVNRDACNYDFTLIANPDQFDAAWPAYEAVIDGFEPS